jgi:hypothetical protein
LGENRHNKDKKLHNSREKLHNSGEESKEATNLVELLEKSGVDYRTVAEDYIAESEARWARLTRLLPDVDERPPDPVGDYHIAIADHIQEIIKKAMNQEPIALNPQPITIIGAPTPSSEQTQRGTIAGYRDVCGGPLSTRELRFTREDLEDYVTLRSKGLAPKSKDWINRASKALWASTGGKISRATVTALREFTFGKYESADSHSKVLSFSSAFLNHLTTTQAEPRYQTFVPYLERPKTIKERKSVTSRIVTEEDIKNILKHIRGAERAGKISRERSAQYSAFVLFGAYSGQRSEATIAKLTVGQFREALAAEKPVLQDDSIQNKIRMSLYVPLHPRLVEVLEHQLLGREDNELMFAYHSFVNWTKREKIPMSHFKGHFVLGDLRKFAEQYGDIIQWHQSNRAYIMTHGVSGIDWKHYKHPLPEHVYDSYMQYWRDVCFET